MTALLDDKNPPKAGTKFDYEGCQIDVIGDKEKGISLNLKDDANCANMLSVCKLYTYLTKKDPDTSLLDFVGNLAVFQVDTLIVMPKKNLQIKAKLKDNERLALLPGTDVVVNLV